MGNPIDIKDGSLAPYDASGYADLRGIVEYGNLTQFAPFEGGYSFLGVINSPRMMNHANQPDWVKDLNKAFYTLLEKEFRGLDGIENITTDTMEITDGISTMNLISKTVQNTAGNFTVRVTEKSGSLYTKYISTYLRFLKDPRTQATTYGGLIGKIGQPDKQTGIVPVLSRRNFAWEVFNFLYVVTDSTLRNVEKAFIIMNAQPTEAAFSDLYNSEKGSIENKEISITFNGFAIDGYYANKIASQYLDVLNEHISFNSYNHDYQIQGGHNISNIDANSMWEHDGAQYKGAGIEKPTQA